MLDVSWNAYKCILDDKNEIHESHLSLEGEKKSQTKLFTI